MRRAHLALAFLCLIVFGVVGILYFDTLIAPYGPGEPYVVLDNTTLCPPCPLPESEPVGGTQPLMVKEEPSLPCEEVEPQPCPKCPSCPKKVPCPKCETCERCEQCERCEPCAPGEPVVKQTPIEAFLSSLDDISNVYEPNPSMDLTFSPYPYTDFPELKGRKLPSPLVYRLIMGHKDWIDDYEQHVQTIFREYAWGVEDCLILDVGANDGQYTHLSAGTGCAVVAFELQPACLEYLHTAVFINNQTSRVRIINRAVHHELTILNLDLVANECNGGFHSGKRRVFWNKTEQDEEQGHNDEEEKKRYVQTNVPTIVLNRAIIPPHLPITLLKVDTEGHEPEILRGAMELFRSKQVKNVLVEIFPFYWSPLGKEIGLGVFKEIFEAGYSITCLGKYARSLHKNDPVGPVITYTLDNHDQFFKTLQAGFAGYIAANVCVDYHIRLL